MKKRLLFALLAVCASTAFASTITKLNDDAFAPLRTRTVMRKVHLDGLPIYDDKRSAIDLEEFEVWAPGGKVTIHGENGVVLKTIDPPPMRFFRGQVNGDPESFAYFSIDPSGRNVQGLIVTRDKRFTVASVHHRHQGVHGHIEESDDTFLSEYNEADNVAAPQRKWECAADGAQVDQPGPVHVIGTDGLPIVAHGITGSQSYAMTVEIETDFELYVNAGNNPAAVTAITNYVTNLTGAVATIYSRDLNTNVTQTNINIYTAVSDPWTQTDGGTNTLNEIGDVYHNAALKPSGRTTSAVVMLSGKDTGSGIAWLHVICGNDFLNGGSGHFAGPYAFCGSIGIGGLTNPSDPNATFDGIQDGMPAYSFSLTDGSQTYWPLEEYAHELGHNLAGQHTHCVAITDAERLQAGFTDGSTADFVDHCYGAEGGGCYSGTTYAAGSAGVLHGTIMSYCHNVFGGTGGLFPQSRFLFGLASEPSHHELDDYMLRATGPLNGGTNIVNGVGAFTMSISAPASVGANSTGNAASVTASPSSGATYSWSITNGTITSSTTTASVTFTAGASGSVVLRAIAYAANKCGITDSKTVTINSAPPPPTNVVATATATNSVHVTWTAASGATSYRVYRSTDALSYALVGSPLSSPFDDTGGALAGGIAYLYVVHSVNGTESGDSNADVATTVIFANSSLSPNSSTMQAADIAEVRTAVDALRKLANHGLDNPGTYTDLTLNSTIPIKRIHIVELRGYIDTARSTLLLGAIGYTDSTITAGVTTAKAAHILDLRAAVQ
jgi:hypothetical protein